MATSLVFLQSRGRGTSLSGSGGGGSAFEVALLPAEHLPDHRAQFAHHGTSGHSTSTAPLDSLVPLAKPAILPQCRVSDLGQQPPGRVDGSVRALSQDVDSHLLEQWSAAPPIATAEQTALPPSPVRLRSLGMTRKAVPVVSNYWAEVLADPEQTLERVMHFQVHPTVYSDQGSSA
jgi:hypothetical protein